MNLLRMLIVSLIAISVLITNSYAMNDSTEILINEAIEGEHRTKENKVRDIYRHPKETLLFFGIKLNMSVLEILPGRGWYTEILAPVLKSSGKLTIASFGENHTNDYLRKAHIRLMKYLDENKKIYEKTNRIVFNEKNDYLKAVDSDSIDMVLTFRNSHNWIRFGNIKDVYKSFHRVLKKGGTLGVVQHRAKKNDSPEKSADTGYVPESYLINLIEEAGFELVKKSDVNANSKDKKNHPKGVWTLPPTLRLGDVDREKYLEIGESDRMTLKFIKL